MAWPSDVSPGGPVVFSDDGLEFRFDTREPIPLGDLAESFAAIDRMFSRVSAHGERLTVEEVRQGSIIGVFAAYAPMAGQVLPYISDGLVLAEFGRRLRKAARAFNDIDADAPEVVQADPVAADLAAVVRPLAGRRGAKLSVARVKYRSRSADRTVEVLVELGDHQIDRIANLPGPLPDDQTDDAVDLPKGDYLRDVEMTLHQANRGPAKARGQTGDKGVIEAVTDKALPVYFAEGISRLKDRMIRSARNPLRYTYKVDAYVHRVRGQPKAYTVTELHSAAQMPKGSSGTA